MLQRGSKRQLLKPLIEGSAPETYILLERLVDFISSEQEDEVFYFPFYFAFLLMCFQTIREVAFLRTTYHVNFHNTDLLEQGVIVCYSQWFCLNLGLKIKYEIVNAKQFICSIGSTS